MAAEIELLNDNTQIQLELQTEKRAQITTLELKSVTSTPDTETNKTTTISLPRALGLNSNLLITSPYTTAPHLLDLNTLTLPYRLMALALTTLTPTTPSYATSPYPQTFNWPAIISTLRTLCTTSSPPYHFPQTSFYCVVFTSRLKPSCNYPDLSALDEAAHAEAMASGGFLKYWFGEPDAERRNLATCIWRCKEDARWGSRGEKHRLAAMAAGPSYEGYGIQGLRLVVGEGVGGWWFEEWVD